MFKLFVLNVFLILRLLFFAACRLLRNCAFLWLRGGRGLCAFGFDKSHKVHRERSEFVFGRGFLGGESDYRHDDETLSLVEHSLSVLKKNIYGFEVDSGKNDIVTGKVDINLAWSGDAVFSMNTAEEEDGVILNYSIPEEGSNIWFDGWCMPKGANKELAYEFLNFISLPSIARLNMEFIGYTSFIAGDEILDMVWDWYGDEEGEYSVDLTYFFDGSLSDEYDTSKMVVKTAELGRQFSAQYPSLDVVNRCAVMEDFGDENEKVVAMWETIKANDVPLWIIITVCALAVGGIGIYGVSKYNKTRHRRRRRKLSH